MGRLIAGGILAGWFCASLSAGLVVAAVDGCCMTMAGLLAGMSRRGWRSMRHVQRQGDGMTEQPNKRERIAYAKGYESALLGDDDNPYRQAGLAGWWATGHADYVHGRGQRYGDKVAVYVPHGGGLPERVR